MTDELLRYEAADQLMVRAPKELLAIVFTDLGLALWTQARSRGLVSESASRACDIFNVQRRYAGAGDRAMTGTVERLIQIARPCAMELKRACTARGFEVSDVDLAREAAMATNGIAS